MKYKVGDKVRVRKDLEVGRAYGCRAFVESMEALLGKVVTIKYVSSEHYELEEDKEYFDWTDEMIEGLWGESKSTEQVSKSEDSSVNSSVKKLKLIDILNKIANGELKEGTKVKIIDGGEEFTYERCITDIENHELVNKEGEYIFENYHIDIISDEVELIEPQEPTECEHEWKRYSLGRLGQRTENHRYCSKCGADEIEPTDNTKI